MKKPKRQKIRRLLGPVELPMTDSELLRDAARAAGVALNVRDDRRERKRVRGKQEPPKA